MAWRIIWSFKSDFLLEDGIPYSEVNYKLYNST